MSSVGGELINGSAAGLPYITLSERSGKEQKWKNSTVIFSSSFGTAVISPLVPVVKLYSLQSIFSYCQVSLWR